MKYLAHFLRFHFILLVSVSFIHAQTHFGPQEVLNPVRMANPVEHQWTDLDADGDEDCLVVSHWDETISWFPNLGNGLFGNQQIITTKSGRAEALFAIDLDQDGDQDIISGARTTQKVVWYENLDGKGKFSQENVISYDMPVDDILAEDLDQDGKPDIIAAFGSTINWFRNTGSGSFEGAVPITEFVVYNIRSIKAPDLNNDGYPDILFCASDNHIVGWIDNNATGDRFGSIHEISTDVNYPVDVFAADLDGDGDADVMSASTLDNAINWYENTDGQGTFGPKMNITTLANSAASVFAADLDNDGDNDILSTGFYQVIWYENLDGQGTFSTLKYVTAVADGAKSGQVIDVNQDGTADISAVYSQGDKIVWFPGKQNPGDFDERQTIAEINGNYPLDLCVDDLDGDARPDVLAVFAHDDRLLLFNNQGERAGFGEPVILDSETNYPYSVWTDDLNGDLAPDIIYSSLYDASLRWLANQGDGSFSTPNLIADKLQYRSKVRTLDFDLDGDRDLIFSNELEGILSILENIDGAGTFANTVAIPGLPATISKFYITDTDQDDIEEIIVLTNGNAQINILQIDQSGGFTNPLIILENDEVINDLNSSDIDGDGFKELIFATDENIVLIENEFGAFGDTTVLCNDLRGISSLSTDDLDLDGDFELIACSAEEDKVYWFENEGDFKSLSSPQSLEGNAVRAVKVFTADIDLNAYPDILSASSWDDKIAWYRNKQLLNVILQPEDQHVCEFQRAQYTINTNKEATYHWQIKKWNDVFFSDLPEIFPYSGTNGKSLLIDSVEYQDFHAAQFRCKIYFQDDSLYSVEVSLYIVPRIEANAGFDQYLCDSMWISLNADDPWPGAGEWSCNNPDVIIDEPGFAGTHVSGLPYGTTSYYWNVTHDFCPGSTDTTQITLYEPVKLISHPSDQELVLGETAQFTAETSGEVFQYQWYKNWEFLENDEQTNGVNGPVLTIINITEQNEGAYYCTIYGRCDTLETDRANLSITTSMDRIKTATIWIGPNPIRQPADLIFHIPGIDPEKVVCYDESGKIIEDFKLISQNNDNGNYTWTIQNLNPGIYYICFLKKKGTAVKKLIISN